MRLPAQTIVASVIGAVSLLVMLVGCFQRGSNEGNQEGAGTARASPDGGMPAARSDKTESAWTPVDSPTLDAEIGAAVASGMKVLVDGGMSEERSVQLRQDVVTIFTSIFTPDFDRYHTLMTSKGCRFDTIADGFSNAVVGWSLYPDGTPELSASEPTRTRVRYLWNHPDERNFRWVAFRPGSVSFGFGMEYEYNSADWPYQGVYSQLSLYIPSTGRLMQEEGDRLSRSKDAVWVTVEGRFKSGMQTRMRIELYYDSLVKAWIPVYIHLGNDGKHRPFPMI
jgi:hypothetical protein